MRLIRIFLLIIFIFSLAPGSTLAQTATPPAAVRLALEAMSPEERVGQLFLVNFTGIDTGTESQIYNLITRYHVGGVVLTAGNDNFSAGNTLAQTYRLIDDLQRMEWNNSTTPITDPLTGNPVRYAYVPLFVGISQEGDGYPTDQILDGLTPLPSEMAVGATWNTEFAENVGEVRGSEISALGFNLFLGPSLDVLETPAESGSDLGARVFGGDPFWVGEMGRAYVNGLHIGSDGKMLVIAKHFPGAGGADRLPQEEVATVRKSLEQLKQVEFAPFFAVTGNAETSTETVDGLLVSHIRYQGFQGNIRATTRPISFDQQALGQILTLPEFAGWYNDGGLLVSDDLGTTAVHDFYVTGGGQFLARVAARDSFLAGNDLLYLGNIKGDDAPDSYTSVVRTLEFFAQKYREDSAFAQRVDASAARILAAKLRLYDNFTINNVLRPDPESTLNLPDPEAAEIGTRSDVTFQVARNAATLISPSQQDLASVLPLPPQPSDRIVFITDAVSVAQCSQCVPKPQLAADALQNAVLRLYGPQSGNQVEEFRLKSYSFDNLQAWLDAPDENQFVTEDLENADWVVVSITDSAKGQPDLISRLLRESPAIFLNKQLILFSFGAPYYFDTTTLSRFTAYYALYSKQPQFVDVAVRLLFQELTPAGASPVSIPAVGYDLIEVTAPNPIQIIPIFLDLPPVPVTPGSGLTPEATLTPLFRIGDTISIRTGVIQDHNGKQVPDGTVVRFSMLLTGEGGGILQQVESVTTDGVARASFGLDKPGLLEIRVASEPAVISEVLQLDVSQSGAVAVTVVVPELTQSSAPTPMPSVTEEPDAYVTEEGYPRVSAWAISMIFLLLGSAMFYVLASRFVKPTPALRWTLGMLLGGLFVYNLLAFGVFNLPDWLADAGVNGVIYATLFGGMLGLLGGWFWSRMEK
jgi:beta-N-acetylhexosaminidase